jgi:hypothetical protein
VIVVKINLQPTKTLNKPRQLHFQVHVLYTQAKVEISETSFCRGRRAVPLQVEEVYPGFDNPNHIFVFVDRGFTEIKWLNKGKRGEIRLVFPHWRSLANEKVKMLDMRSDTHG